MKVLPDWKVPPLRLYSSEPVPPEAVTVSVVLPPLQAIDPAEALALMAVGWLTETVFEVAVHPVFPERRAVTT